MSSLGAILIAVAALASSSRAGFEIASHSVQSDPLTRQTAFSLTFNQPPDFLTTNDVGSPRHAFQYFYDSAADSSDFVPSPTLTVIRGGEIHFDNNIPIRHSLSDVTETSPRADGWGPVRAAVPFELDGENIRFTVAWEALLEDDTRFTYSVTAFEEGSVTNTLIHPAATTIPLPRALVTGIAGLCALAAWTAHRRHLARSTYRVRRRA